MFLSRKIRISKEDRTLTALSRLHGRVYVYCGDSWTMERFIEDADNECFHYGDGVKVTERKPDGLMVLNSDKTINYPGFVGTMAFHQAKYIGIGKDRQPIIKVDYRKYISGYKNFIYNQDC